MPSKVSECATMVKRGTKTKIEIKKRETKQQRSVTCSKRRQTLFSKAADLCLFSGANIAVFVTSPAENSGVVYSFSGYSPASEIANCYFNGKAPPKINPQSKVGFWWEEKPTDLYHSCNDLSELNIIEDRLQRMKKHILTLLEKKENSEFVSNSHQNPSTGEISNDVSSCSQIGSLDGFHGCQNPNYSEIASIDQNSYLSLEKNDDEPSSHVITCFDQNPSFSVEEIYGEYSYDQPRYLVNDDLGFVNCLWETEKDNKGMSVRQETFNEDLSFWGNLCNDDDNVFSLNNGNNNLQVTLLPDHSSTNEEDGLMIDVGEFFSDEEIELLQF